MQSDASVQEAETQVKSFYPADGVFIALGIAGSTEIARQMGAEITDKGNIKINEEMETTIPDFLRRETVREGFFRYQKRFMKAVWPPSVQGSMSAAKNLHKKQANGNHISERTVKGQSL